MTYPLFAHQREIIEQDPKKTILALGTGSGKTRIALHLAKGKTLVICPKQQKLDQNWEAANQKYNCNVDLTVISKEMFKKVYGTLPRFETVILEEAHTLSGVTPQTQWKNKQPRLKTSQIYSAVVDFIRTTKPDRVYAVTATPASKPLHVYALASFIGIKWDQFGFRQKYYYERRLGTRQIWLPNTSKETLEELSGLVKRIAFTGRLQDWFDVPEQTHQTVYLGLSEEQKKALKKVELEEPDPMTIRAKKRQVENGILYTYNLAMASNRVETMVKDTKHFANEKIEYIKERALEFDRMLIFANYTGQVKAIQKALEEEGYKVLTLTGQTKNRENVIKEANELKKCIVIAQSDVSAGYELPQYPVTIFASYSYKFVSYEQGLGRILRANHLKKNLYIHLVVKKGVDHDCYKTIHAGKDFIEKIYERE